MKGAWKRQAETPKRRQNWRKDKNSGSSACWFGISHGPKAQHRTRERSQGRVASPRQDRGERREGSQGERRVIPNPEVQAEEGSQRPVLPNAAGRREQMPTGKRPLGVATGTIGDLQEHHFNRLVRSADRLQKVKGGEGGKSVEAEDRENALKDTGHLGERKNRRLS